MPAVLVEGIQIATICTMLHPNGKRNVRYAYQYVDGSPKPWMLRLPRASLALLPTSETVPTVEEVYVNVQI